MYCYSFHQYSGTTHSGRHTASNISIKKIYFEIITRIDDPTCITSSTILTFSDEENICDFIRATQITRLFDAKKKWKPWYEKNASYNNKKEEDF